MKTITNVEAIRYKGKKLKELRVVGYCCAHHIMGVLDGYWELVRGGLGDEIDVKCVEIKRKGVWRELRVPRVEHYRVVEPKSLLSGAEEAEIQMSDLEEIRKREYVLKTEEQLKLLKLYGSVYVSRLDATGYEGELSLKDVLSIDVDFIRMKDESYKSWLPVIGKEQRATRKCAIKGGTGGYVQIVYDDDGNLYFQDEIKVCRV